MSDPSCKTQSCYSWLRGHSGGVHKRYRFASHRGQLLWPAACHHVLRVSGARCRPLPDRGRRFGPAADDFAGVGASQKTGASIVTRRTRRVFFLISAAALGWVFLLAYGALAPVGFVQSKYGYTVNAITVADRHITD